jgi:hypothetical protein
MKFQGSFFLMVIILLFTGCKTQKEGTIVHSDSPTTTTPAQVELSKELLVISFEQTACYGTCPVHKMEIFGKGFATYHGKKHVAKTGDYIGSFTPKQLTEILTKANEIGFFEMQDEYTANMTDLPTTVIYINNGNQKKKVVAYTNYPDELKEFITYLYGISQNTTWTGNE